MFVDSTHIWDNPYNGQIRLQRGTYSNQGLVEVYCNGEWGTICDDSFGYNEARVVCRQLGYNDYYDHHQISMLVNVLYASIPQTRLSTILLYSVNVHPVSCKVSDGACHLTFYSSA